jgi:hypothetical protein
MSPNFMAGATKNQRLTEANLPDRENRREFSWKTRHVVVIKRDESATRLKTSAKAAENSATRFLKVANRTPESSTELESRMATKSSTIFASNLDTKA